MADLPRYQQTGRTFADLPEFSFANVKESFRRSQSMINSLDRISQFAAKFAETQVEQQAAQYAVENPITIDELRNAQETGVDPNDLIKATGGGAIWQETLRKVQGEQLRAQLEVYGQQSLSDIQTQVQLGQLTDINEIKQKFQAAISGYEKPLARISPDSAVRFQQSMASTAKAFFNEATKKLEQDYINDQQVLSMQNLDNSLKAAKSMISVINDPQMLDESKRLLGYRVYEQAREGGTAFAQKQLEAFNKDFEAMKIDHFVGIAVDSKFATSLSAALDKIDTTGFGNSQLIFNSLPKETQLKVKQNVISAWNNNINAQEQLIKQNEMAQKAENKKDYAEMVSPTTSTQRRNELAWKLFNDKDFITKSEYENIINPSAKETDSDIRQKVKIRQEIENGFITNVDQLNKLYPNLSAKVYEDLAGDIFSVDRQKSNRLKRLAAGASENTWLPTDTNTNYRIEQIDKIQNEILNEYKNQGKPIGLAEAADLAVQRYKKSDAVITAEKTQTYHKNIIKGAAGEKVIYPNFPLDNELSDADINTYAAKYKITGGKLKALKESYKAYFEAKKLTGKNAEALQ